MIELKQFYYNDLLEAEVVAFSTHRLIRLNRMP